MIYSEGMVFDKKTKRFILDKEWVNNNVMKMDLTTVDETDANVNTLHSRILKRVSDDVYRFIRKNAVHYEGACYQLATDEELSLELRNCLEYQLEKLAIKGDESLEDEKKDNISPNVKEILYSTGVLSTIIPEIPDVEVW
jgi:hypothetical protein